MNWKSVQKLVETLALLFFIFYLFANDLNRAILFMVFATYFRMLQLGSKNGIDA